MEVRGGNGYIEEWSDARVLRDAYLGSIWEGTSNVVALDVKRAIRREQSLEALRTYAAQLLDDSNIPAASRARNSPQRTSEHARSRKTSSARRRMKSTFAAWRARSTMLPQRSSWRGRPRVPEIGDVWRSRISFSGTCWYLRIRSPY